MTVLKAWVSSGPLIHDAPEYIYYWVWLQGTAKDGKTGNGLGNLYTVELLNEFLPKKRFALIRNLYGQIEPPK